ncbi:hypothetical protein MVEN_01058100 [Mycena venus]|uniref:Uncharacterized protein n=1 Tax=Mycena venus TaxID=2733690 RepID=A0A8H6Y795_9AGAR|nr:hypothetical protein MVEN_01058100 [Mycena venus]
MSSESKGKEPADGPTSRLLRTLKRTNAPNPPAQSASSSKGKAKAIESVDERRQLKLRRVDVGNAESARKPTPSSSRTTSMPEVYAPEPRPRQRRTPTELTEVLESLTTTSNATEGPLNAETEPTIAPKQPESTFLAQKIRGLINSLPALSSRFLPSPKDPPIVDSDGRPIPPPGAVRIQDPELISLLSNPDVMNGSDGRRQSVWSMLEAIKPPTVESTENVDESYEYTGSDRSSVMMYSPLIPNADSVIELAESEEVPIVQSGTSSGRWFTWPDWSNWLFNGWKDRRRTEENDTGSLLISTMTSASEAASQNEAREETTVAPPVRRVWVPSTTQLSFETTWWGYRIYLPPPVLAVLDDQSVEAAKQATVITAALTWFFTNLPVSTFPPPVQPAIILLQKLVPLVSYLGTFISWSWSTIRGFDQGHGVILTATWLLPIALIPGTWHARDVPPSSPPALESAVVSLEVVATAEEELIPLPPAPVPAIKPLPPCPDEPPILAPPLKQRKSSTSGKSKINTLRKLTRTASSR